ncbi:MAG: polysaccharide biosynthesis/export family protein [Gammaproteobacteria bacterium]|nr:polysaccharide biosynthesis/export family protein [Gammaproteobacteria bacterium]
MKRLVLILLAACLIHPAYAQAPVSRDATVPAYLLGPGDILDISIWKEEGMQKEVIIRPDGAISFPLVGEIHAGGKSIEGLQAEIKKKVGRFIPDAVVTVGVLQINSNVVYVLGKVNRPGQYAAKHYVDVTQALAMAGGLTAYAAANSIKILRRSGTKHQVFEFKYGDVEDGDDLKQNIVLESGDVIIVP